jgi:hypothetical protein
MSGRNGNSGWSSGARAAVPPAMPTAFDKRVGKLSLTAPAYLESRELREWCEDNCDKCYIPEWLLKAWGIEVKADLG